MRGSWVQIPPGSRIIFSDAISTFHISYNAQNLFLFRFLPEEIEAALSPTTASDATQNDHYEYETLKRAVRDLNSKSSADQLTLLENVFKDGEHTKTAKRSRTTNSHTDRHRIYRRDSLPKYHALKSRKINTRFTKLTHRNIVPAYYYEPIKKLPGEVLDKESADIDLRSAFSAPHALNTMASPYQRALTVGMNNNLEAKATAMLKRVGLGLVTISDLSLEMTATMKEVVVRVSGRATPKKIGGWFNFEVLRKDIFAVGFTAKQDGFEDFVEKIFNTSVSLFKNLEKTSVSILLTGCNMKANICVSGSFDCNVHYPNYR